MTSGLLCSIKHKNKLYKKYIKTPTEANKTKYIIFRNKINTLLRKTKIKYFQEKFIHLKHDLKSTWKAINLLLNKNSKGGTSAEIFNCEGRKTNDPEEIANAFNNHFADIGPSLARNISQSKSSYQKYLKDPNLNSLFFNPTTSAEIENIALSFKNNKSPGLDEISPRVVKSVITHISNHLCYIFNLSLSEGIFQKLAKVIPVYKNGDKSELGNYRPISILSVFSKILEKIVHKRTMTFLEKYNIIHDSQYGFRPNFSTSLALTDLSNKVTDVFEKNMFGIGVFLDLSKAFDTLNHNILLDKLNFYGIRGVALDWFSSYLRGRSQRTKFQSTLSEPRDITCGVPQGSLLGPLLFIIYVNDICKASDVLSFLMYADDTNIFLSNKQLHSLINTVNHELNEICTWFRANKLSLNTKKCNYIIFTKTKINNNYPVKLDNMPIEQVLKTKFLGIYVDDKLSWKHHIHEVENKVARSIGIITKMRSLFPDSVLRSLYCSLILPYF